MAVDEWTSKWNPFNSDKALAHVPRWQSIVRGEMPDPALLQVDPAAQCNLACSWCNAKRAMSGIAMTQQALGEIVRICHDRDILAVCIGGGGEPTMNKYLESFVCALPESVRVGVVTNGVIPLSKATRDRLAWASVSVDAATAETFAKAKGVDAFRSVIDNMQQGDTFKFLFGPDNAHELADAAALAKSLGCRYFHARPVATPWFSEDVYAIPDIAEQVARARKLETGDFRVFCVTHKQRPKHFPFGRCHAIYMQCTLTPAEDGFNIELCCDRRGDPELTLATGVHNLDAWGSKKHRNIIPDLRKCPRCTYQPHNVAYEQVVELDAMTWEFL
jgi:MoaA/NifB/PqqE/SkfB family radical SAM enzyme